MRTFEFASDAPFLTSVRVRIKISFRIFPKNRSWNGAQEIFISAGFDYRLVSATRLTSMPLRVSFL
jgi:hypothetical protein